MAMLSFLLGNRIIRTLLLGGKGERLAERNLKRQGYRLLRRNYRCPLGEVDLIARDGEVLVFVEVKARTSDRFGHAVEAVGSRKQRKLMMLANHYLKTVKGPLPPVRFDVVTVHLNGGTPKVEHFKDAFEG